MKIAAFNVENLFDRAKALNEDDSAEVSAILDSVSELNGLFEKSVYNNGDKIRMLELLRQLGLENSDKGEFVLLRQIRGRMVSRPKNKPPVLKARGRDDWIGWAELRMAPVNDTAIFNTGQVIRDVDADVLAVIEAEDRVALKMFSDAVLKEVGGKPYHEVMVIDGNDTRGIDVGLMTKVGFHIGQMRSHIHDLNSGGRPIFSRDCPEYSVKTPDNEVIWFLPNHFKSKFGGDSPSSRRRREAQAKRTAEIYQRLISEGHQNIVVLGDLNDTPDSTPLRPLLQNTDLRDVTEHSSFDPGEFPGTGTFGLGNDNQKLDYLLLSPALFARVRKSGLFRKGAWPGSRPKRWSVYPELKRKVHIASDHHVIWAELD